MSDITKCNFEGCPLKEKCYRYTTTADELWQSYFSVVPYDKEKESCNYFWELWKQ